MKLLGWHLSWQLLGLVRVDTDAWVVLEAVEVAVVLTLTEFVLDVAAGHQDARLIRVEVLLERLFLLLVEQKGDLVAHCHRLDNVDVAPLALSFDLGIRFCDLLSEVLLVIILKSIELLD